MAYFILLLAILFPWGYGQHEAEGDYDKILADASADSLKERFHANNLLVRGSAIFTVSAVVMVAMHWLSGFSYWFGLGYFCYCSAVFGYTFTSHLNTLRGLGKWYVSSDKKASKTDQAIIKVASKLNIKVTTFSGFLHTVFLIAGIITLAGFIYSFMLINK